MLATLLVFDMLLVLIIIFTTHMIEHKFGVIKNNIRIYDSRRNYKTQMNLDLIDNVLEEYYKNKREDGECDAKCIIIKNLKNDKIGKFSYPAIINLATKTIMPMCAVLLLEIAMFIIFPSNLIKNINIIFTVLSIIFTIIMFFYCEVKGIKVKEEIIINELVHYVKNVYPSIHSPKQNIYNVTHKNSEINTVEDRRQMEKDNDIKSEEKYMNLNAYDIAKLIEKY